MTRNSAFTYLFWGFLFQLFNFYVQGVNLFPDVVGFVLTAIAANHLREQNSHFGTVFWLSFPLMLLSLPNIHQSTTQVSQFNPFVAGGTTLIAAASFLEWFLALILVFHVCKGIEEIASERGELDLARRAMVCWRMYLWLQIGVGMVIIFGWMHALAPTVLLGVILFIYSIAVVIVFLTWLWACRNSL